MWRVSAVRSSIRLRKRGTGLSIKRNWGFAAAPLAYISFAEGRLDRVNNRSTGNTGRQIAL
jgi:hypothetical protein